MDELTQGRIAHPHDRAGELGGDDFLDLVLEQPHVVRNGGSFPGPARGLLCPLTGLAPNRFKVDQFSGSYPLLDPGGDVVR